MRCKSNNIQAFRDNRGAFPVVYHWRGNAAAVIENTVSCSFVPPTVPAHPMDDEFWCEAGRRRANESKCALELSIRERLGMAVYCI